MKKHKILLVTMPLLFLSTLSFNDTTSTIVSSINNDVQITKTATQEASLIDANADYAYADPFIGESISSKDITQDVLERDITDDTGVKQVGDIITTEDDTEINKTTTDDTSPKVDESRLTATTKISLSRYLGLQVWSLETNAVYTSASWLVGLIGHSYETKITSIIKVKGVYSYLPFISRESLISGSSLNLGLYTISSPSIDGETMYFYNQVDGKVETSLYTGAYGYSPVSANDSVKTVISYKSDKIEYYTRKSIETIKYSTINSITSSVAPFCPEGYSITIGQRGTFYEVTAQAQIYQNWWWNSHKAYGDPIDVSFIICDVSTLVTDFVYKKDTGSSPLYYIDDYFICYDVN